MADPVAASSSLKEELTQTLVNPMAFSLEGVKKMAERIKTLEADRTALIAKVQQLKGRLKEIAPEGEAKGSAAPASSDDSSAAPIERFREPQKWAELRSFFQKVEEWNQISTASDEIFAHEARLESLARRAQNQGRPVDTLSEEISGLRGEMKRQIQLLAGAYAESFEQMAAALETMQNKIEIPVVRGQDGSLFIDRGIFRSALAYMENGRLPGPISFVDGDLVVCKLDF